MLTNKQIEEIENKYLNKFYHFMKYTEDEMMFWFQTKEKIKDDWIWKYWTEISFGSSRNIIRHFILGYQTKHF